MFCCILAGIFSFVFFQSSDGIDAYSGDISVTVVAVTVICGVKCDTYKAFVVLFVYGVGLVPYCLYVVVDNSYESFTKRCR